VADDRRIVLLIDNFARHKLNPADVPRIELEFFSPNLTCHVQPCDAGVIASFKAQYRRLFVDRVLDDIVDGKVSRSMFDIDLLEALFMAKAAWGAVTAVSSSGFGSMRAFYPLKFAPTSCPWLVGAWTWVI